MQPHRRAATAGTTRSNEDLPGEEGTSSHLMGERLGLEIVSLQHEIVSLRPEIESRRAHVAHVLQVDVVLEARGLQRASRRDRG